MWNSVIQFLSDLKVLLVTMFFWWVTISVKQMIIDGLFSYEYAFDMMGNIFLGLGIVNLVLYSYRSLRQSEQPVKNEGVQK